MEWRKVKDFMWYYVSNTWMVKSVRTHINWEDRILKFTDRKRNYICYLSAGGKHYTKGVHNLVAEAFIPNPSWKRTVNHKNGDKHDNRVENLERTTDSENCKHRFTWLNQKAVYHWWDKKPVIRIGESGEEHFDSLKDAHIKTWTRIGSIRDVCNWKQNKAWWYRWKWGVYDEKEHNKDYHRSITYKGKRYPSIWAFAKSFWLDYQCTKYRIDHWWSMDAVVTWSKNSKFNRTRYEKPNERHK